MAPTPRYHSPSRGWTRWNKNEERPVATTNKSLTSENSAAATAPLQPLQPLRVLRPSIHGDSWGSSILGDIGRYHGLVSCNFAKCAYACREAPRRGLGGHPLRRTSCNCQHGGGHVAEHPFFSFGVDCRPRWLGKSHVRMRENFQHTLRTSFSIFATEMCLGQENAQLPGGK